MVIAKVIDVGTQEAEPTMQLTLYYAPISCALVPYVALTEARAQFDVRVINVRGGEQLSADYLKINPKHKVPVLLVDGQPLTENVAILQWIAHQFPEARLLPTGFDAFKAISLLTWCASGIHPHLTPNLAPERYCDVSRLRGRRATMRSALFTREFPNRGPYACGARVVFRSFHAAGRLLLLVLSARQSL